MTHLGADRPRSLREGLAVFRRRWPEVAGSSEESPVFLLAAGWRCGSTLVQRMFSRECLVWGEPYEEAGLLDTLFDVFRRIRDDWPEESFFLRGQTAEKRAREFIANLYPPPAALAAAYASALDALFAEPARRAGVARWGIKSVRLSADHAHVLRWLYPRAKIVFLTRDPYDAYRSYRAIRHPRGVRWFARWPDQPLTTERFFRHWAELSANFLDECSLLPARLLRYEDLVSGRVDLAELAALRPGGQCRPRRGGGRRGSDRRRLPTMEPSRRRGRVRVPGWFA